jgi:hypothetical protein
VGFVVDKVALGQGFSEYFGFPLPIFIPPISPQSPSPIIRRWYNRPVSGRSTQSPTAQIKNIIKKGQGRQVIHTTCLTFSSSNDSTT